MKKISKVCLVHKRSLYQKYILEEKRSDLKKLYKKKHLTTKNLPQAHIQHNSAIELVKNTLKEHKISYKIEHRHQVNDIEGFDLVITIGGDGTFLRSSHFVKDQLILGVNSSPKHSVGALCSITAKAFPKKFKDILAGRFDIKALPRMKIQINGKTLQSEAINDVLFTNHSPAATSRYFVRVGRKTEEHKSSGVWISTMTGSSAAIQAAGGMKMAPRFDKHLQFLVREPYQGQYNPYRLTRGFIEPGKNLKIINKMLQAMIYVDGPTTFYDLNYGDEITFSLSKKRLNVII